MRTSRGPAILAIGILFSILLTFQNCGPAFKAAGKAGSGEFGSQSTVGSVLKLTPFDGGSEENDAISVDFSKRVMRASVSNLQGDAPYLSNGKFKVSRDTAFPSQIAKPGESLMYAVTDPRFRQVNTYYHLNLFTKSLANNGVFPSEFNLLTADAHCEDDDGGNQVFKSNAYYDPTRDLLCMGVAEIAGFKAWASNDADVLVHEFGHSINHQVASTEIMSSTVDMGSFDEGLADVWAFSENANPRIGLWYGSAIYEAGGVKQRPFPGLRDLNAVPNYPVSLQGEKHLDSIVVSTIFSGLSKKGVDKNTLQTLGVRVLENMQMFSTFGDAVRSVRSEGAALGILPATIDEVLNARKLLRKDNPAQLSLVATKPVYVIDSHDIPGFQEKGNCDGALDAGESAVIYANLQNVGAAVGTVSAKLISADAQITVLPGATDGTYSHLLANTSYSGMMFGQKGSDLYLQSLIYAAFAVKVADGTPAGTYNFNLRLSTMNTLDTTPQTKDIPFSLVVGTDANIAGKCPGNGEMAVYP